jgi:hypothetical protein
MRERFIGKPGRTTCSLVRRLAVAPFLSGVMALVALPAHGQRGATLVVSVSDFGRGSPIADADVYLAEIGRHAHTDASGEARVREIPRGVYELRVRRLGFAAAAVLIAVQTDSSRISVLLRPAAATLDTVRVVESALMTERHREFELRRRGGLGRYLGPEQLAKESLLEFPVVAIQHFPGLALITGRAGQWQLASRHGSCGVDTTYEVLNPAAAMREPQGSRVTGAGSGARQTVAEAATSPSSCFSDHPCHVKLFLDDQPVAESDIGIVHTSELYGVEYYSTGNAPPRYQVSGAACGIILLWTRTGNSG